MIVTQQYTEHYYDEDYVRAEALFCPCCGAKGLWRQAGDGDYYQGPEYICAECAKSFATQGFGSPRPEVVRQLKSGVKEEPTTPRGH